MSRERTDADDFSIAMFGAIVVAVVLIFVIAGLVTHWEKSEASANLKGDHSRVAVSGRGLSCGILTILRIL